MKEFLEGYNIPYKLVRNIIVVAVIIAVLLVSFNVCTYNVNEKEAAAVFRMGQIVAVRNEPGLHATVPFINSVKTYPMSLQESNVSKSEVLTLDKKNYVIDTYVIWRIADLETFIRSARTVENAEEILDSTVYGITKRVLGSMSQDALIGVEEDGAEKAERDVANDEITTATNQVTSQYGIEVLDVKIKALDVPEENESAIFTRMISERNQSSENYIAAGELEKSLKINEADKNVAVILATAKKEAEMLRGEAEAEYMRIWAEAYNSPEKLEFYEFVRALEALEVALKSDQENGVTLILDSQSPLAEIINGN